LDPSKSSSAGTEFNKGTDLKQDSDDLTKEFVINGKYAFCVECDIKLHRPKCAGCRKPIRDEALGAMGAKWHKECFCCAVSAICLTAIIHPVFQRRLMRSAIPAMRPIVSKRDILPDG
jgi:hypothetical protein